MKVPHNQPESVMTSLAKSIPPSDGLLSDASSSIALSTLAETSILGQQDSEFCGRSVLIRTRSQIATAMALIALDGLARRIVVCPPDLPPRHVPYIIETAEADAGVTDEAALLSDLSEALPRVTDVKTADGVAPPLTRGRRTEWVLLTSGTTGVPKLVVHTLASLTGAIKKNPERPKRTVWSTLYDIRRFGGLQIFLRAILNGYSMVASDSHESVGDFFRRAATSGVTHISGTPSQWRRALTSPLARLINPDYVRLSGEVVDRSILTQLRSVYPHAQLVHAFASTEAGVAFEVHDSEAGFPAETLNGTADVEMTIRNCTLHVHSSRTASRYLGKNAPELHDDEGFVDTGDIVDLRNGRYYFAGRQDHVINVGGLKVHPEEIEAVINRHPEVSASLVRMKKNPITGALVVADVVLRESSQPDGNDATTLQHKILQFCRGELAPYKVPVAITFVPSLAVAESGKLVRRLA